MQEWKLTHFLHKTNVTHSGVIHKWRHPRGGGRGLSKRWQEVTRGRYPVLIRGDVTPMIFDLDIMAVFSNYVIKTHPKIGVKFVIQPWIISILAEVQNGAIYVDFVFITKKKNHISIHRGGGRLDPGMTSPQGGCWAKGDMGWQGEGGGSKNWNFWVTSFMDDP